MNRPEPVIYELSEAGRCGVALPDIDEAVGGPEDLLPDDQLRSELPLPEVSQVDVIRHFVRLSQRNFSIDTDMYPLGSCTMKQNPKINEATARLEGFNRIHPAQGDEEIQGALELLHRLAGQLGNIAGFAAVTLQPAAGAQGEFSGLLLIRAHHLANGQDRRRILIPDSAHGTNPATASMCGFESVAIPSNSDGEIDFDALMAELDESVAGIMMTVPNTLGVFETRISDICRAAHAVGAQVYCDGANMNAMLGRVRPGDLGIDVMHLNLHKTFSTPHGGGGPGAGALCCASHLERFLPTPMVARHADGTYFRDHDRPDSIGQVHSHLGNFGNLVRAYTYICSNGDSGLKAIADNAVLNANYLRVQLQDVYELAIDRVCMHEVVFSGSRQKRAGASTLDIAKRLIDFGFHPPTIYFPLVVKEALMIEPTETESRQTLDRFIAAMRTIAKEADENPKLLQQAPHRAPIRRLNESAAARRPDLRFRPPAPAKRSELEPAVG